MDARESNSRPATVYSSSLSFVALCLFTSLSVCLPLSLSVLTGARGRYMYVRWPSSRQSASSQLQIPLATNFPGLQSLACMLSYIALSQNALYTGAKLKMSSQHHSSMRMLLLYNVPNDATPSLTPNIYSIKFYNLWLTSDTINHFVPILERLQ